MWRLLLPALMPSWRFFDSIRPSPRIQFALLVHADDGACEWREFRPRPERVSLLTKILRLFFNPYWNESLYLVTCAEKIVNERSAAQEGELISRVADSIERDANLLVRAALFLRVRVVLLKRQGEQITQEVKFVSAPRPLRNPHSSP